MQPQSTHINKIYHKKKKKQRFSTVFVHYYMCYTGIYKADTTAGNHSRKKKPYPGILCAAFRKGALVYIGAPPAAAPEAVSLLGAPALVSVCGFGVLWRRRPRASLSRPAASGSPAGARVPAPSAGLAGLAFPFRSVSGVAVRLPVAARVCLGAVLLSARVPALPFCLALPSGCRNGCITKAAGLPCGRRLRLCLCSAFRKCVPQKK